MAMKEAFAILIIYFILLATVSTISNRIDRFISIIDIGVSIFL